MRLMMNDENTFMENFSTDEKKVARKRIVGMILATDMAAHASHINVMQYKVKNKNIKMESNNGNLIIDQDSNEAEKFTSQQQFLDFLIHASDLSTPTRKFETLKEWTYLLFEEFFIQGDVEKSNGMQASFLCDRTTTKVANEQPGFCNYIVIPIWNIVSTIMPQTEVAYLRAQENVVNWAHH